MSNNQHNQYMIDTYLILRRGMATIAFAFPIALLLFGPQPGLEPEPSISAYYWVGGNLRDLFVGVLCAIGVCLMLYKGPKKEDLALDLAGLFAILVAFFEMREGTDCMPQENWYDFLFDGSWHGEFAFAFFAAIAYVCIFLSTKRHIFAIIFSNQEDNPDTRTSREKKFDKLYTLCGTVMVVVIVLGVALKVMDSDNALCEKYNTVFWTETFAIWTFAAFWLIQTIELDQEVSWMPARMKFWQKHDHA